MSIGSPRGEAADVVMIGVTARMLEEEARMGTVREAKLSCGSRPTEDRGVLWVALAIVRCVCSIRAGLEEKGLGRDKQGDSSNAATVVRMKADKDRVTSKLRRWIAVLCSALLSCSAPTSGGRIGSGAPAGPVWGRACKCATCDAPYSVIAARHCWVLPAHSRALGMGSTASRTEHAVETDGPGSVGAWGARRARGARGGEGQQRSVGWLAVVASERADRKGASRLRRCGSLESLEDAMRVVEKRESQDRCGDSRREPEAESRRVSKDSSNNPSAPAGRAPGRRTRR